MRIDTVYIRGEKIDVTSMSRDEILMLVQELEVICVDIDETLDDREARWRAKGVRHPGQSIKALAARKRYKAQIQALRTRLGAMKRNKRLRELENVIEELRDHVAFLESELYGIDEEMKND